MLTFKADYYLLSACCPPSLGTALPPAYTVARIMTDCSTTVLVDNLDVNAFQKGATGDYRCRVRQDELNMGICRPAIPLCIH